MHSLAWLTHFLRLVTIINEHNYFAPRHWTYRVLFVHYYHDLRGASPVRSKREELMRMWPTMLSAIVMVAVSARSLQQNLKSPETSEIVYNLQLDHRMVRFARYVLGSTLFVFSMTLLDGIYRIPLILVLGISLPSTFRDPHRSKTLAEFWSKRWNLVVRNLLSSGVFKPMIRLTGSHWLARMTTFVASGILHVVPLAITNQEVVVYSMMMCFFIVMGLLIEVESALFLNGRLWLFVVYCIVSPLFYEPLLVSLSL